jgi:hypothetical protein
LITAGHRAADVWKYTPRQLRAFHFILERRKTRERAEKLSLAFSAARGEEKEIRRRLKEWSRE